MGKRRAVRRARASGLPGARMHSSRTASALPAGTAVDMTYGRWPVDIETPASRLSAHDHALFAFADAAGCEALARRLQGTPGARAHCRRLRPEAMARRVREAIAQRPARSIGSPYGGSAVVEGLMPLVRAGSHWLVVRIEGGDTAQRLRRALRGQAVRCALMFGELAVEDLMPRRPSRQARSRAGAAAR